MPRRQTSPDGHDPLLEKLDEVERQLEQWIGGSEQNAEWFRRDPLEAMRAAGLNMDDEIMLELEIITKAIAKKLK